MKFRYESIKIKTFILMLYGIHVNVSLYNKTY
jgi:hypothetical protein